MRAKFKGRKKRWEYLIRLFLIALLIIISFVITFKALYKRINFNMDNNSYINYLVNDSFSNFAIGDLKRLSSTEFLLKYSFGIDNYNNGTKNNINTTPVVKEEIVEPIINEPLVYIFNTHQTEEYNSNFKEEFNINNTVYIASHILKEYLDDLGIKAIVEENSIIDILNTNGWKYNSSYKASRILLEQAYKDNPSLMFFVDLHRDSARYNLTTCEIDNKKYAKIMFVVGLEHEAFQVNLDLANHLNEKLKEINPLLSRGVLEKKGAGVNGIYNQDFNKNTILIEVGGQYNTIEEVNNTLNIVARIIYDYIRG